MQNDQFDRYISEINQAYSRGDATEHTYRPALKNLIEAFGKNITATNEPKRTKFGAPDFIISRKERRLNQKIGYIECKDIGISLKEAAKTEQIRKRYLPSFHNFILTDYIEFWWYIDGEKRLTARLAEEKKDRFKVNEQGRNDVAEILECFFSQEAEKVTTAKDLAIRMAHKARMMRDVISKTFEQEAETGTLHGQYEGFKEVLIHDLTEVALNIFRYEVIPIDDIPRKVPSTRQSRFYHQLKLLTDPLPSFVGQKLAKARRAPTPTWLS